ncbi:ATP-binding protein [Streptomyces sp. NBC_00859]|uniref:ATP-binding protein n=1 Tax=Streptomyces sp. NBC_00859 TaxID=2903682 RepID=UPI00386AB50C|nr:ATP-binding protein [Streptomyces sp. NBC_00859]
MNDCRCGVQRKSWELAFSAEPEEVAGLRNVMRLHLGLWGLQEQIETAQLCVSELTANVIRHVGPGTPTTLAVSMNGTYLRIEVHDPDTRALPTLIATSEDSEAGRGMTLVDAMVDRWGVQLRADRKVTWCELATGLVSENRENGHSEGAGVARAEAMLAVYGATKLPRSATSTVLSVAVAEAAAIDVIADFLHWLRAHGCDPDEALDRAQRHFEAELRKAL